MIKQMGMFGTNYAVGSSNISDLIRQAIDAGHSPDVARAIAFWKLEPTETLLLQMRETSPDEHEALLLDWSNNHNAVFESIARSKRKQLESDLRAFIGKPSKYHKRWLSAYYDTDHWKYIKREAAMNWDEPGLCVLCQHPRDDWHHPTYTHIGTDQDAKTIVPVCDGCHVLVHVVRRTLTAGEMPQSVRDVFVKEGVFE